MNIILFTLLALIAEVIGTIGGFGSSMFFVPLASFFFDMKSVLGITAIFHVFSNISKLVLFRATIDWRVALAFGIPSVIFVILGAWLTTVISFRFDQLVLGIFLIVFSSILLARPAFRLQPSLATSTVGGGLAGFLAGFVGTGGAVRGLCMAAYDLEKNLFVGTSAAIDLGVDVSRAVIYTESGYVSGTGYQLIIALIVVSVLGSYIGKLLLQKIDQENFRRIVLLLILAVGLTVLGKAVWPLITTS
ncbi:MAG: sulfite exporter TauE/SafE family protein [Bacteroidetes bacterium]|nr:sulfite exporter TauE/SafE family protein [Bacteroidota bacterium]